MIAQKIKVLLVEDNQGDVILLVDTLDRFGGGEFELVRAADLDMALKRLREEKFNAVLLDLSLPLFLGLEPIERVHRLKPKLPIVVLSGYNDPELATEAMRKGAKNFFVKGHFEGDALVKMLRAAVGREVGLPQPETASNT
jgi:DNA-binding NtrC family response regulator